MTQAFKSHEARCDLLRISLNIGQFSERAAQRFLTAAEETFELLASFPSLGSACEYDHPMLRGLRLRSIKRFRKYVILYRPLDDGIEVVRVFHGARDIESLFEQS